MTTTPDPDLDFDSVLDDVHRRATGYAREAVDMLLRGAEHEEHFAQRFAKGTPLAERARVEAEELRRIAALLGRAAAGTRYDPALDAHALAVAERLAARARAAEAGEAAERARRQRLALRADVLVDLASSEALDTVDPQPEDLDAWGRLHGGPAVRARLGAWMAQALHERRGALSDPVARAHALEVLPASVLAHLALLDALALIGAPLPAPESRTLPAERKEVSCRMLPVVSADTSCSPYDSFRWAA
ncbi:MULTISPECIES: hypothetical protein [unclassified Streptomyces]|uniref:hypothetical protein n=1 Tax=unclassified Streptomyces TaxID=2593676 RepID=UPI00081E1295|nr:MULTISPECIES: hypothetical protein [unclassified Streptomyces]MYR30343.1 hypothetical protein [Streptomyces sp. SID4945]SCF49479.1 hypothetical protein GA0115257_12256 [Streptomyces sp. LcepLS]